MRCRTNGTLVTVLYGLLSDLWDVGPMGCRTNGPTPRQCYFAGFATMLPCVYSTRSACVEGYQMYFQRLVSKFSSHITDRCLGYVHRRPNSFAMSCYCRLTHIVANSDGTSEVRRRSLRRAKRACQMKPRGAFDLT